MLSATGTPSTAAVQRGERQTPLESRESLSRKVTEMLGFEGVKVSHQ